jgi:hypothetical protein
LLGVVWGVLVGLGWGVWGVWVLVVGSAREQAMAIRRLLAPGATAPPSGRG